MTKKKYPPVEVTSILNKKFKYFTGNKRLVLPSKVHALMVISDLRRGSLVALDRYLAQNKGIDDPMIALELRKLISGSQHRTPYRLMVIHHPDNPRKGGRPKKVATHLTEQELAATDAFKAQRTETPKNYTAIENVTKDLQISPSTIARGRRKVKAANEEAMQREELIIRKNKALGQLRAKQKSPT